MFGSASQGGEQADQLYFGMLGSLLTSLWSAAEYLQPTPYAGCPNRVQVSEPARLWMWSVNVDMVVSQKQKSILLLSGYGLQVCQKFFQVQIISYRNLF